MRDQPSHIMPLPRTHLHLNAVHFRRILQVIWQLIVDFLHSPDRSDRFLYIRRMQVSLCGIIGIGVRCKKLTRVLWNLTGSSVSPIKFCKDDSPSPAS